MNVSSVEEAIVDWHRLGKEGALPCSRLWRLNVYLTACPLDHYVTFHLKTCCYFTLLAYQIEYWKVVSRHLDALMSTGTNGVIRAIESELERMLSPGECLLYGHTQMVVLGGVAARRRFCELVQMGERRRLEERIIEHVVQLCLRSEASARI